MVGRDIVGSGIVEDRVHLVAQDGNISRFWDMHWPWTLRRLGPGKAMLLLYLRAGITHDIDPCDVGQGSWGLGHARKEMGDKSAVGR